MTYFIFVKNIFDELIELVGTLVKIYILEAVKQTGYLLTQRQIFHMWLNELLF